MAEKDQEASRKAAIARLKKEGKAFDASKKKEAPKGYTTKEDIIAAFKLKDGKKVTVNAKLTRIGIWENKAQPAKKVNGKTLPAVEAHLSVAFNFYCLTGIGKGQTPSKILNLVATPKIGKREARSKQDAYDELSYDLQRCGFDVGKLKGIDALIKLIDKYNEAEADDKHVCSITINAWKGTNGLNCGVRINRQVEDFVNPEDEEDEGDEDEDSEDDEDEEEEEAPKKSKSKKKVEEEEEEDDDSEDEEEDEEEEEEKPKKKSKKKVEEEEEEEDDDTEEEDSDDDEEEEEEDDEVEYDEDDPNTWIGYRCKAKPEGTKKVATYTIDAYVKRGKKLTLSDTKGNTYTIAADDVTVLDD